MSRQSDVCPGAVRQTFRPSDVSFHSWIMTLSKSSVLTTTGTFVDRSVKGAAPGMSIQEASTVNNVLIAKSSRISLSFQGRCLLLYFLLRHLWSVCSFPSFASITCLRHHQHDHSLVVNSGETLENNVRRNWLRHLRTHLQPLQKIVEAFPEFSACLKAASISTVSIEHFVLNNSHSSNSLYW